MASSKKIATHSDKDVYLAKEIYEKINTDVKGEKKEDAGTIYYIIKEVKHKEDHTKFISDFMKRMKE